MQPGDLIEIITDKEILTGTLVKSPESEKDVVVIKLKSGYNIGIEKDSIKETKVLNQAQKEEMKKEPSQQHQTKGLRTISILHTGGTIASKVDYRTGAVVARFTPEEILAMFPELREMANIKSRLLSNMWSEDMRFAHYNIMAKEAAKEAEKGVDGIIITHGTDTMHYSSAALAFALEGLGIPVILVGAQRSSDRGSTDAALNLLSAAFFIANTDFAGVAICMHETVNDTTCLILPPMKTRKMHASRRDAFRPINSGPIAKVSVETKKIDFYEQEYNKIGKEAKIDLKLFNEKLKIGMVKTHPNMNHEEFMAYSHFDGLVIEGFALGHAPINKVDENTEEHLQNLESINALCQKMPVVMASQSIYGRINLNVYSTGRDLQAAGVLGHLNDMTPETAFIKLAWLLSNYSKNETKSLITKNLRGEVTERTEEDTFLR